MGLRAGAGNESEVASRFWNESEEHLGSGMGQGTWAGSVHSSHAPQDPPLTRPEKTSLS